MSLLRLFHPCAHPQQQRFRWLPWVAAAAVMGLLSACKPHPKPGPQSINGYVQAAIHSDLAGPVAAIATTEGGVVVPDIEVVAKNVATGVTSAPVKTDPYGYFRTALLPPGKYQICVSGPNYVSTCDPEVIKLDFYHHEMRHIVTIPAKLHVVAGTVTLADKTTPCFWYDPAFDAGHAMTAVLTLVDSGGNTVGGPIRGNNTGQFVIPTPAPPGTYELQVECEAEHVKQTLNLTQASLRQAITLPNHAPSAELLEVYKGGVGVRRATPSDVLTIKAPVADSDHDVLHYQWIDDANPSATFADNQTLSWTAPSATGPRSLRVLISDGRGGHLVRHTSMNVGPDEMVFSGVVINRATHGVEDHVDLTINGVPATSNAEGRFIVKVPDSARFVVNARKTGFALTSRIFYQTATDVEVFLDPATIGTVDVATGGEVKTTVRGCAIPAPGDGNPGLTYMQHMQKATRGDCDKIEIGTLKLTFPAHSLMLSGSPYGGTADVESFQYDLSLPNAIPGDQSAIFKGRDTRLATFGAIHVTPRDAVGHPLTMAPGKAVEVSMPIHPAALSTAPARIPFFSYDEPTGKWVEHGELVRVGNNYVGKLTHFSQFNADTTFGTNACLKIQLVNFPLTVRLNAVYNDPATGNFNHPNTVINDANQPIVIERMPPNSDFTLVIDDNSAAHNVLQNVALNSGPPTSVNYPAQPPYTGCNGPITIYYNRLPSPLPNFLITGTAVGPADYQAMTTTTAPYTNRNNLTNWKNANHFGVGAETHGTYFNNGDLKFGRDMHCQDVTPQAGDGFSQPWVACYVSNYGLVGVDFSAQPNVIKDIGKPGVNPVATVAMEYHPDQPAKVQFWAYDAGGNYLASPQLDSQGPKPMPDICMACHQGDYGGTGQLVTGAVFLPFDADLFLDDDGNRLSDNLNGTGHRPTQEAMRQLNSFALRASNKSTVAGSGTPSPAYDHLMELWYKDATHAGVNTAGAQFHAGRGAADLPSVTGRFIDTTTTPQSSKAALYNAVVAKVCRTCHIARDPGTASASPAFSDGDSWGTLEQMTGIAGFIQTKACGPSHASPHFTMPKAEVPFNKFWHDSLNSTLASELFTGLGNHDCTL